MKVLLVDNYDSFTFNLYQFAGELLEDRAAGSTLDVVRNDEIQIGEVVERAYDRIIISPGPGDPRDPAYFGVCGDILKGPARTTPTMGVCLGMQGMSSVYGGDVIRARVPMHGKTSLIWNDQSGVFHGLPRELMVMRYHSLKVDRQTLPDCFTIISETIESDGIEPEIMGIRHREYPLEGSQFHPESFATEAGMQMVENFLFPGSS